MDVAPGVRRIRPDDHFMILSETDATPMHVGALIRFDVGAAHQGRFGAAIRRHVRERLGNTPLLAHHAEAPDGYDSDVWIDAAGYEDEHHFCDPPAPVHDEDDLHAMVARLSLERLDLARPPFRVTIFDRLKDGRAAIYLKMHHAIADGIGFQTVLQNLSDAAAPAPTRAESAAAPPESVWRAASDAFFADSEARLEAYKARRRAALAAIEQLSAAAQNRRAETPAIDGWGPTSATRAYATISVPLARVQRVGKALGGTVNDVLLAAASMAIRETLLPLGRLPPAPIVVNSARSYRRAEHGAFGNRIVALHPHLATHEADPRARFTAIRDSMAAELRRSPFDEALLDAPETPFGARDRRARFAARAAQKAPVLPGNVTISNVPGPATVHSYAGFAPVSNHPAPILGSGRFLNFTSRRNGDTLDIGVMTDPEKLPDPAAIARSFLEGLALHERLAG